MPNYIPTPLTHGALNWDSYIVAADMALDTALAAQAGNSVQITEAPLSPKRYGVVADGVTDDSAAWQAAINALPTQGGEIHFPAAVSRLNSTVDMSGKRFTFRGAGIPSIFEGGAGFGSGFVTGTAGMTMFKVDGGTAVNHWGPTFDGIAANDVAGGSTLVNIRATNHVVFRSCSFRNAAVGVLLQSASLDCSYNSFYDCVFYNNTTGLSFVNAGTTDIHGGQFRQNGVGVDADANSASLQAFGVKFEPNTAGQIGWRSKGHQVRLFGCPFELAGGSTTKGLIFDGSGPGVAQSAIAIGCSFVGSGTEIPWTVTANAAYTLIIPGRLANVGAYSDAGVYTRVIDPQSGDVIKRDASSPTLTRRAPSGTAVAQETHDSGFMQRKLMQSTASIQEVLGDTGGSSKWILYDSAGTPVLSLGSDGIHNWAKVLSQSGYALPGNPTGWKIEQINGVTKRIPYWDY